MIFPEIDNTTYNFSIDNLTLENQKQQEDYEPNI